MMQEKLVWDDAGNVLLKALPAERSFKEWAETLLFRPEVNLITMGESCLNLVEQVVVPTLQMVELALSLHSAVINAYRKRDPRRLKVGKELLRLGILLHKNAPLSLGDLPNVEAAGGIVQGPTGSGKSHALGAILRKFNQTYEHGRGDDEGWCSCVQLVYLRVFMPADNTRRGLFGNILYALDAALGTTYRSDMPRSFTLDQQLIYVIQKLKAHYCGVLILEEMQERNFGGEVLAGDFANLFLSILNHGIPIFLVGNPNAFVNIIRFSQDRRRLTDAGSHDFYPLYDCEDADWRDGFVQEIWSWPDSNKTEESATNLHQLLYERTGGIPSMLARYRRECLVLALRTGSSTVKREHMDEAYYSNSMIEMHSLINAFRDKNLEALRNEASHAPIAFLSKVWARERLRSELTK